MLFLSFSETTAAEANHNCPKRFTWYQWPAPGPPSQWSSCQRSLNDTSPMISTVISYMYIFCIYICGESIAKRLARLYDFFFWCHQLFHTFLIIRSYQLLSVPVIYNLHSFRSVNKVIDLKKSWTQIQPAYVWRMWRIGRLLLVAGFAAM